MTDSLDPFDFILAESLGKFLYEIDEMPNNEYYKWRAFYKYRHEMQKLEAD